MNIEKKNKNNSTLYIIINIFLIIICYILTSLLPEFYNYDYSVLVKVIGWISNIMFLICEFLIYKKKKTLLDFDVIFFLFFSLFCNGQIFLYSLGVNPNLLSVFERSSYSELFLSAKYYCISQMYFSLGILLVKSNCNKDGNYSIKDKLLLKSLKMTGLLILLCSCIPFFYNIIPMVKNSITHGYGYLYSNSEELQGMIGYLSTFFIPSLFILLYTNKNSKVKYYSIFIILVIIAILYLIIGTRSTAMRIIVSLVVFYNLFIKKIKWRKAIKLVPILLIILVLIPAIHQFRGTNNKSISIFKDVITETINGNNKDNFVIQSISELGFSSYAFTLTERVIPHYSGFRYGQSYIASLLMLIPSPLLGGFTFAQYANLDVWLQNVHHMSYGPGFSITAETYYNFGFYFGPIFTLFVSMFFSYMFDLHSSNKDKNTILKLLSFVFFYSSLIRARFPFHGTIRNVFYMYICIYFIVYLLYGNYKRRRGVTDENNDVH